MKAAHERQCNRGAKILSYKPGSPEYKSCHRYELCREALSETFSLSLSIHLQAESNNADLPYRFVVWAITIMYIVRRYHTDRKHVCFNNYPQCRY